MGLRDFINNYGSLNWLAGKSTAKRYCLITIGTYLIFFAIITFFTLGSIESVIGELIAQGQSIDQGTDSSSTLSSIGMSSAIFSMFLVRYIVYFREVKADIEGIVLTSVWSVVSIFTLFFWGFALVIMTAAIGALIYLLGSLSLIVIGAGEKTLFLFAGISYEVMISGAFGVSAVVVVWRTKRIFPKSVRESVSEFNDRYEDLSDVKNQVKSTADEDLQSAASQLIELEEEFRSYNAPDEVPSRVQTKLVTLENEIHELADRLFQHILVNVELAIDNDNYLSARDKLETADDLAAKFGVSNPRHSTLRDAIDEEFEHRAADLKEEITKSLEKANTARESGKYDLAENHVLEARDAFDELCEIPAVDFSIDLRHRIEKTHEMIRSDKENNQIRIQKEALASQLDTEPVDITVTDESVDRYEALADIVSTIQEGKSAYSGYPWKIFEDALLKDLSHLTVEELHKYEEIASSSMTILEYLSSVDEVHPSIDSEDWRDAVSVSLEEQYSDILSPIISQIERLKSGLWEREQLDNLSWKEFEELIGSLYNELGYDTEVTQGTADLGVDVWAERPGERVAIQVKQYKNGNTVGRETLQKLVSTIAKGDADRVVVVTSGNFARTAEQYADDFGADLQLIDGEDLVQMLSESEIPPAI